MANEHDRIMDALLVFYTEEEALRWLSLPHPQLNGETAESVIAAGNFNRVWQVIDRLQSGAYT